MCPRTRRESPVKFFFLSEDGALRIYDEELASLHYIPRISSHLDEILDVPYRQNEDHTAFQSFSSWNDDYKIKKFGVLRENLLFSSIDRPNLKILLYDVLGCL